MGGLPPNGHFRRLRRLKSGRVDFRVLLFLLSAAINRLSSSDSFEVPKLKPKMADQVVEIAAFDVPDKASVKLRLTNLALHSSGVFGNVYSGQMHSPVSKKVAIKKIWPENASTHKSLELLLLTRISREPHKNVVQMLFTYQSITEDKVCEAMVFDFLPATLASAIKDLGPPNTDLTDIKVYCLTASTTWPSDASFIEISSLR
ncbi:hypothetical protein L596_027846 [Steinernema carpocapsae]|uniref:Protein kinase domain-containing protein n=1 Tax=Steinernema carpocapsae TaxID=34508 RepID=A0A4U5LWP3_STECR|nr:hypothetical protein L596_027846 [Steinernema carpocapsae]